MPPRKKVKTDHVHGGTMAATGRKRRLDSKVATAVAADVSRNDQPQGASVAPSVVKLRKGCLKEIPNFAVEIQLMIFGNLHPQDLFNLSRTSKVFHGFFLHRSNEALWEASLKNTDGLPERPPWMSIPAFIHLLYSTHCHRCGCANIRKVVWPWFARYCSNCLPKVSIGSEDVSRRFLAARCDIYPYNVLAYIQAPTATKSQYHNSYWGRNRRDNWYLERHVDQLIGEWTALPEPRDLVTVKAFDTQHYNDLQIRRRYALQCKEWHDVLEEGRKEDLREGREDRFSEIIERLIEMGWKEDLDFLGPRGLEKMSRFPVVRQSSKLTDKGWEKVQEALHQFLNDTREKRLKEERDALIKERFAELDKAIIAHCITIPRNATMECHPLALDLALQLDLEPVANAPSSECITQETFSPIIPKLVANWEDEQRRFLRSFLGRFITKLPRGVDILDLAIATFYSSACYPGEVQIMRYPYILTWSTLRHSYGDRKSDVFDSNHYAAPARPSASSIPCDLRKLEPKPVEVGIKWMRAIITKLGLNPNTATLADLEQCEARLRCLKCAELGNEQFAYTWEAAFAHTAEHNTTRSYSAYPKSSHSRWSRVDEADMAKVKELEAVAHALSVDTDCCWSCALCIDWRGCGGGRVRKHLTSKHNIEDVNGAIDDGTIFWNPVHNDKVKKPAVKL